MKKITFYKITAIYCLFAFFQIMTPFRNPFIMLSTMPIGLVGAIFAGIKKDWKWLYFNLIGIGKRIFGDVYWIHYRGNRVLCF